MNALKKFKITRVILLIVTVLSAALVAVVTLLYGFWDAISFAAAAIGAAVVFLLGLNVLWLVRMGIGRILTRRCDVVGYEEVYRYLYDRSGRKTVRLEQPFQRFCIAFYSGKFDQAIRIFSEIDMAEVLDQPELIAYLSYAGYARGRDGVTAYAAREMVKCICFKKKCSEIEGLCRGVVDYADAMREGRYTDAVAALPPRNLSVGNRYISVFFRYCFACAEYRLGHSDIAGRLFSEIAESGGSLCFSRSARDAAKKIENKEEASDVLYGFGCGKEEESADSVFVNNDANAANNPKSPDSAAKGTENDTL